MPLATSVAVHVTAQKIIDSTHVTPQWAKRFEGLRFKNKYKFMILKITFATNKGSICLNQREYKIYITISIQVLFWCLIYTHNIFKKLASFICAYFINFKFNVCVLAAVFIGIY